MKHLIILVAFVLSGQASAEFSAFGAANISTCESFGARNIQSEAEAQAKKDADADCQNKFFEKASVARVKIIGTYRGSCWAGTNSGVAVELYYVCE